MTPEEFNKIMKERGHHYDGPTILGEILSGKPGVTLISASGKPVMTRKPSSSASAPATTDTSKPPVPTDA